MKPVNYGVTKYPQLEGLHGAEYRNAWNKIHRAEGREASRRFNKTEKGKKSQRKWHLLAKGTPGLKRRRKNYNKRSNDKSRKVATMSGERWGPVEDAMLFSGMTHSKLVHALGRSILAIQLRKYRLKKLELAEDQDATASASDASP